MISEWLRELLKLLTEWVEQEKGYPFRVFFDLSEIQLGDQWPAALSEALSRSKLLLAALSPHYFQSNWCVAELQTFLERTRMTQANLIVPIVLHGGEDFPDAVRVIQWADFREYVYVGAGFRESTKYFEFQTRVRDLAHLLVNLLRKVPAFDKDWPIVSLDEAAKAVSARRGDRKFPSLL